MSEQGSHALGQWLGDGDCEMQHVRLRLFSPCLECEARPCTAMVFPKVSTQGCRMEGQVH